MLPTCSFGIFLATWLTITQSEKSGGSTSLDMVNEMAKSFQSYPQFCNFFNLTGGDCDLPKSFSDESNDQPRSNPNRLYYGPAKPSRNKLKNKDEGEVIERPTQAEESCKQENVCVPLPIDRKPGQIIWPKCVSLPRCIGGCCETFRKCDAAERVKVKVKVLIHQYQPGQKKMISDQQEATYVDVEKHTKCNCS